MTVHTAQAQKTSIRTSEPQSRVSKAVHSVVVDVRPGPYSVRAPSLSAFYEALAIYSEFQELGDAPLQSLLSDGDYSPLITQGKSRMETAALSFGVGDCPAVSRHIKPAILIFAAAMTTHPKAAQEALYSAYLYLFFCAEKTQDFDSAMHSANFLRYFNLEKRPKEISEATWEKYPRLDISSNRRSFPVQIDSHPSGVPIWLDYTMVGSTPMTLLLKEGQHILALGAQGQALAQQIFVHKKESLSILIPDKTPQGKGIEQMRTNLKKARLTERGPAIRNLMAALEVDIAFVMRDPGRTEVWALTEGASKPELVGHAPNAEVAGRIALNHLEESTLLPNSQFEISLRDLPQETSKPTFGAKQWWVYGAVLGAAAGAAGFIIFQDLGQAKQRIEITLP